MLIFFKIKTLILDVATRLDPSGYFFVLQITVSQEEHTHSSFLKLKNCRGPVLWWMKPSMVCFTSLQFFVPMRRAIEQKLLKYVPCSTLNSDSSAPLHWTTQHGCSGSPSSSSRSLVGVWHREFPSVTRTHMEKHLSITENHPFQKAIGVFHPTYAQEDGCLNA